MTQWQRRLTLFGQEWCGALMVLWLRYQRDPLLGKAAIGYALSMVLAYALYWELPARAWGAWRMRREVALRKSLGRTTWPSRRDGGAPPPYSSGR
jgi:hypothetical protein